MKPTLLPAIIFTLATLAQPARAGLVAYDGFDYLPLGSDLLGQSGGTGFSAAWSANGGNPNANYDIGAGSLSFANLLTSGNRVVTGSGGVTGISRPLAMPGTPGSTQFVSFLLRPEGILDDGDFNGFFGITVDVPGTNLFAGKPGDGAMNEFVLEDQAGANQVSSGVSTVIDETALIVLRMDHVAGPDNVTMYLNPTPGDPEPASGTLKSNLELADATALTILSSGAFSFDELRVGDTFASVTPVPEPAGSSIFALGLSGILFHRRRRAARCRIA